MKKFWIGFITAIIVILLAGYSYVRFGFVDPRADIPVGVLESKLAMPSLDAAIDRRAPDVKNPVDASDTNLIHGMKIYQANCAGCHGDIRQRRAQLADAFYPRAPQFLEDAPDMPENQNHFIIQHGIRLSGMPAWSHALSDQEIWTVTAFLSHMNKLPPQISEQWKAEASTPTGAGKAESSSPDEP